MLNGKKGFIAVTLVMATILIGYFAPGWYTWTVSYTINPLTSFEEIVIPKTTGGTVGCACWPDFDFEKYGDDAYVWWEDGSVGMYVGDGSNDWAGVDIEVDIQLKDIAKLSFWKMVSSFGASGWNPNIILAIDADGDGDFDGNLPEWHFDHGTLGGDGFVEGESPLPLGAYDTDFVEIDAMHDFKWWGADDSGFLPAPYVALDDPTGFQYNSFGNINPTDRVMFIKIVIGGASSWMEEKAYVRLLSMNDEYLWFVEQIEIDKPLWIIFAVSLADINDDLIDDYECLLFSIHIFDKETCEIVPFTYNIPDDCEIDIGVGLIPLVICDNTLEGLEYPETTSIAELWNPGWISCGVGFVYLLIHLPPGQYGIIKDVVYWTAPVCPDEVSGSFTVCIFAIEDEAIETFFEHFD